ncbi:MAG: L-threonylcarbamoyladenylate synthase, partial [Hyphomonadaceae bacterium]
MRIAPATPDAIAEAAEIIRRGGLVAIPTETVYGLAADAANPRAIARLYAAKGRPAFNPLIAHLSEYDHPMRHAALPGPARELIARFWPGPLTIVAPFNSSSPVCDLARAGLDTIALRTPRHPAAQGLLALLDTPLAAPSANRSGAVSPTEAAHVAADLGEAVDLILDGGACPIGVESTIVGFAANGAARLLRPGGVPLEALEALFGPLPRAQTGDAVAAPGMLARHYAPRARLRLNAAAPEGGEAYLAFGPQAPAGALNLSASGDLEEAAANLYAYLRRLDAAGVAAIAAAPIPETGLGGAI